MYRFMVKRPLCLLCLLLTLFSCDTAKKTYRIGVDPSWYPLELQGRGANLFAFSNELLKAIEKEERVIFKRVRSNWNDWSVGLEEGRFDATFSSMIPRPSVESYYQFSHPFFLTGPVLILPAKVNRKKLGKMEGKELGVSSLKERVLLLSKFPLATARYYSSIPMAMNQVVEGEIDGFVAGQVDALIYRDDFYRERLVAVTPPLDDAGLRLIALAGAEDELIDIFNRGVHKLQKKGTLKKLIDKWFF